MILALLLGIQSFLPTAAHAASGPSPVQTDISYEEVLADSDNADLNYRYARQQAERGNFRAAVSALERVLAVSPERHNVRLYYALILFRAGSPLEARKELDILSRLPLPREFQEQVKQYRALVYRAGEHTRLSGYLGLGFGYDDNRNLSPASGQSLLGDTRLVLHGDSLKREDTRQTYLGHVELHRDLGAQAGHELLTSFTYYRVEQAQIKDLNLQAYSVQAGGVYKLSRVHIAPTLIFDHILLAQTTYLRNRGVGLTLKTQIHPRTELYLEAKDVYQDFSRTAVVPRARERDGILATVGVGSNIRLTPAMRMGVELDHGVKHASARFNAFKRYSASANYAWMLPRGKFVASSLTLHRDIYAAPETFISQKNRRDDIWRVTATFGTPLGFLNRSLKDLIWSCSYEYDQAVSNIINYSYTSNKIGTMLVYKWEAGF